MTSNSNCWPTLGVQLCRKSLRALKLSSTVEFWSTGSCSSMPSMISAFLWMDFLKKTLLWQYYWRECIWSTLCHVMSLHDLCSHFIWPFWGVFCDKGFKDCLLGRTLQIHNMREEHFCQGTVPYSRIPLVQVNPDKYFFWEWCAACMLTSVYERISPVDIVCVGNKD